MGSWGHTHTHTQVRACAYVTGNSCAFFLCLVSPLPAVLSVSSLVLCTYNSFCGYGPRNQMFLHTESLVWQHGKGTSCHRA